MAEDAGVGGNAKPFKFDELLARIRALHRRGGAERLEILRCGPISLDRLRHVVSVRDRQLDLTVKEFDLLAFFAARPRHTFSRDELLRSVWQSAAEWQRASTVTEHVRRLRSKLEPDSLQPRLLRTVRGFGYRFDPA